MVRMSRYPVATLLSRMTQYMRSAVPSFLLPQRLKNVFHSYSRTLGRRFPILEDRHKYSDDWARRTEEPSDCWVTKYWNSYDCAERRVIISAIAKLAPASALELGSNVGPNLRLLAQEVPNIRLVGVDVNPEAVRRGNQLLTQAGISNAHLVVGRITEMLSGFPAGGFDVVFSCYALTYVHPHDLPDTLQHCLRIARLGLVLVEPGKAAERVPSWCHDYQGVLRSLGHSQARIRIDGLPHSGTGIVSPELKVILTCLK